MAITAEQVKQLRDKTGAGMMDCKTALTEADGDMEKAIEILRKKGLASAAKRAGRATKDGMIGHYIHMGGKVAVLVEVNCETDFVARTEDFQRLAKELAMHIAAARPLAVSVDRLDPTLVQRERAIYAEQARATGKPENIIDKIVDGRMRKYYEEAVFLEQPFVVDSDLKVKDAVDRIAEKIGSSITVTDFARFALGEGLAGQDSASSDGAAHPGGA